MVAKAKTADEIRLLVDRAIPESRLVRSSDSTIATFFQTAATAARSVIPTDSLLLFDLRHRVDGGQAEAARLAHAAEKAANKLRFKTQPSPVPAAKTTARRPARTVRARTVMEEIEAVDLTEAIPLTLVDPPREPVVRDGLTITPVTTIRPAR